MNCEQLEPWISAYQDGEIDGRRRRIVEAHLADCPDCRALCHEWAGLALDLRADLSRLEAPESLHARVMRRVPERTTAAAGTRVGLRWPQGWLSFGLAPIGAVAAWLLLGSHPAPKVALAHPYPAATVQPYYPAAPSRLGPTIEAVLPGDPWSFPGTGLAGSKASARERTNSTRPPKKTPAPALRRGKTEGRSPLLEDPLRRLRRLRPRRWRYPLAGNSWGNGPRSRRHHSGVILASWTGATPRPETRRPTAASPRISVVEYVLPEVVPPIAARDAGTEFVLRPGQPVPVNEAGFDL